MASLASAKNILSVLFAFDLFFYTLHGILPIFLAVLSWGDAVALAKHMGKLRSIGEAACERDVRNRFVVVFQHSFGTAKALLNEKGLGGDAEGFVEDMTEMIIAHVGIGSQACQIDLLGAILTDIIVYAFQLATAIGGGHGVLTGKHDQKAFQMSTCLRRIQGQMGAHFFVEQTRRVMEFLRVLQTDHGIGNGIFHVFAGKTDADQLTGIGVQRFAVRSVWWDEGNVIRRVGVGNAVHGNISFTAKVYHDLIFGMRMTFVGAFGMVNESGN